MLRATACPQLFAGYSELVEMLSANDAGPASLIRHVGQAAQNVYLKQGNSNAALIDAQRALELSHKIQTRTPVFEPDRTRAAATHVLKTAAVN